MADKPTHGNRTWPPIRLARKAATPGRAVGQAPLHPIRTMLWRRISLGMYSPRAVDLLAARADLPPRSHRPVEARKHRAPAVKFGTSGRGSLTTSASPGPQYSAESGIGKQQLSRHKSSGSVKFPTAKRFVEKEVVTPGPDAYSGDGGAVLSRNRSTPAFTMGAR